MPDPGRPVEEGVRAALGSTQGWTADPDGQQGHDAMCGITGFIDPLGRTPEPERALRAMRETLTHRGPDDRGEWFQGPAYLGHRRLSIVDLSEAGRQPFISRDPDGRGDVAAMANGEIYDHARLRRRIAEVWPDLELPRSDCAVLPWLWRLERERLPEHLGGMFGVAVWDARSEELLLARDPAGQKPMYYAPLPGGGIAFASEPKALLVHPLVGRDVDPVALRRFLTFDYIPGEATAYQGIRRLPPGGRLLWKGGRYRVDSYYDVQPSEPAFTSRDAASEALWSALGLATEARLMADVPLGVFLSGGLDSTAIVAALAERMDPTQIRTFNVAFEDRSFDESSHARRVSSHFGTQHFEERLEASRLVELVPQILAILDEPFADPSIVPTYLLSQFARKHVTVALGGDGGDEQLLGYPTFFAERVARWAERIPAAVRRVAVEPAVAAIPTSDRHFSLDFKLRRFLSGLDRSPDHRHPIWVGGIPPEEHNEALAPALRGLASDQSVLSDIDELARRFRDLRPGATDLDRLGWEYFRTYLADGVLTKVDRASMAHSLEVRAPLLDRRVLAVTSRTPASFKLVGTTTKKVLRDKLERLGVPRVVWQRPKKGFGIPLAAWLRGPLQGWMREVLEPERIRAGGLLDPRWTSRLMEEHLSGKVNHRKPLWSAISLELWRSGPWGPGQ